MQAFINPFKECMEYNSIRNHLEKGQNPVLVTGCIDSQKCHFIYGIGEGFPCKLIVTYNEAKAKEIFEDYKFFDANVYLYPAKDAIFYSADIHGNLIVQQRMDVIKHLLSGENITVVTTLDGCMDHILPLEMIKKQVMLIEEGKEIHLEELAANLLHIGYEREAQVEGKGQFAMRGGIIDIYPLTEECPVRIELWDEEVDSIRFFDVESQRSIEKVEQIEIYPAAEYIFTEKIKKTGLERIEKEANRYVKKLRDQFKTEEAHRIMGMVEELKDRLTYLNGQMGIDSYVKYFYDDTVSFIDYFDKEKTVFFLDESNRLIEKGETIEEEFRESMIHRIEKGYILPEQAEILFGYREILVRFNKMNAVFFSMIEKKTGLLEAKNQYYVTVKSVSPYNSNFELLIKDLKRWKREHYRVILVSGSRTRAERLAADLREYDLNSYYSEDPDRELKPSEIFVIRGNLHKGFEYPMIKFAVISEADIFGREKKKRRKKTAYEGQKIQSFTDLNVGDYVVHENHGLGIYRGIEKVEVEKTVKDYIKIEYSHGGNLYILATQLDLIQKYAGSDVRKPKLNRLGSQEWTKTKTRVRGAVKEIAKDLVELYAKRQAREGFEYGPDTVWQKEFEELFPYEETEDQLLAIEATKRDMESRKIMDRLICGDVGYGKTEIAIRAAFKAVQEGKQVVYLVPTTILAQQHYNTFAQRMKDFPVRVDLLSRFRTPSQQKNTLEGLRKGAVDIVIGTHRVLSSDIQYKDLGLLIIDEEQRFGVSHKEKIKKLKENVDVLTLTATPIPRTLHMSLIGIRDMSVLEEPPTNRMPIQTYVMEYNDEMVREAITREVARGGQVYYVYNRVNNIEDITYAVARLVPDVTVAFAHGQMKEHQLEKIMFDFINGDIDVLVSTTIIETGLDISNVNTMIIHDADQLGLSQLYQLRGRVGRSGRTAYAFLMYKRDKMLKEVAEKRLQAIREFTELGSGFKIAMRDLEIRGAGNILGAEQHGHMEAVGYDLYCKMLNEAVKNLKGNEEEESFETAIDLDVDAFIPDRYIKSEMQKLDIYKRIAGIETAEEYSDMQDELIDRFGDMPRSVENLLRIALIKAMAHEAYVIEVKQIQEGILLTMYPHAKVHVEKIPELIEKYNKKMKFTVDASPYFTYFKSGKNMTSEEIFELVKKLLIDIKFLLG
jgi:transcription-repair coupling factor (superfamily II helicase)